jgi:hypothetical protein
MMFPDLRSFIPGRKHLMVRTVAVRLPSTAARHPSSEIGGARDVAGDLPNVSACPFDLSGYRGQRSLIAPVHDHLGAFGGEPLRNRCANAARAAGDECDLVVQRSHGRPSMCPPLCIRDGCHVANLGPPTRELNESPET